MKNVTDLEVQEVNGQLIHEGVIRVPYTWGAGEVATRFYAGLADRKIYGVRCPTCKIVFVPPKKTCHRCFTGLADWVEVSNVGTLQTFTVVHYVEPDLHPVKPPFAYGIVKLDGADTGMAHIVTGVDLSRLREGVRLRAVFRDKPQGNYLDIACFTAVRRAKHV